jgi:hypothetical protein
MPASAGLAGSRDAIAPPINHQPIQKIMCLHSAAMLRTGLAQGFAGYPGLFDRKIG